MPSVFLGTPSTREFSAAYVSSLWLTRFDGPAAWHTIGGQAIDIARNMIIKTFLSSGMDFLLMHDSDASWHPEAPARLVSRNLPVVTGIIFKRALPTFPTIGKDVGPSVQGDGTHLYNFAGTLKRINEIIDREKLTDAAKNELLFEPRAGDIQEIDGAGAHFMLIRRDVLEKIKEPWYQCTNPNAGEDFDFCRKVQAAGFKLYVDYSVFTGHIAGPAFEIGLREYILYGTGSKETNLLWMA